MSDDTPQYQVHVFLTPEIYITLYEYRRECLSQLTDEVAALAGASTFDDLVSRIFKEEG